MTDELVPTFVPFLFPAPIYLSVSYFIDLSFGGMIVEFGNFCRGNLAMLNMKRGSFTKKKKKKKTVDYEWGSVFL